MSDTSGRPFRRMNGLDLAECLDQAHAVDPHRGAKWEHVFLRTAAILGYVPMGDEDTFLQNRLQRRWIADTVGMPLPDGEYGWQADPVWPFSGTGLASDGLISTDRLPSSGYRDLPGRHRHRCAKCGTVWQHPDKSKEEPGNDLKHTCPSCGHHSDAVEIRGMRILYDYANTYVAYEGPQPPTLRVPRHVRPTAEPQAETEGVHGEGTEDHRRNAS